MNHEPSGSASTARPDSNVSPGASHHPVASAIRERRHRNRLLFNKKRHVFLKDYLRNLDLLIYAELAAVYYMDCSFTRFTVRALVQFMFLTPKPSYIPEPPTNRPYVGAILGSNMLCLILHLLYDAPSASEATRGYLHGGLAMDFIGQKGPTSKLHLVLLDLLILSLQIIALGAHITRLRVQKQSVANSSPNPSALSLNAAATADPAALESGQDLDHEERGIHRIEHLPVDLELQTLNSSGRQETAALASAERDEATDERAALLESIMQPRSDAHLFDAFNSGEIMILDLDIAHLLTTQVKEFTDGPQGTPPIQTGQSLAERLSRRGLGFRIQVGDRILSV